MVPRPRASPSRTASRRFSSSAASSRRNWPPAVTNSRISEPKTDVGTPSRASSADSPGSSRAAVATRPKPRDFSPGFPRTFLRCPSFSSGPPSSRSCSRSRTPPRTASGRRSRFASWPRSRTSTSSTSRNSSTGSSSRSSGSRTGSRPPSRAPSTGHSWESHRTPSRTTSRSRPRSCRRHKSRFRPFATASASSA